MNEIIPSLLLTLVLGAFIGLQFRINAEEKGYTKKAFAGMRTCIGITLLGYLSVFLSTYNSMVFVLFAGFFLSLILLNYVYSCFTQKRAGGTSEVSLAILFLIGMIVGYGEYNFGMIITIVLSIISSGNRFLYQVSDKFNRLEIIETLKFAIIIFLVLPLLPNHAIDPWGIINPYSIWLMVILISGISYVGYMANKFVRKDESILVSGFVGGLASSLAVATSMAIENLKRPQFIGSYSLAIILASSMVFVRVLVEVIVINRELLTSLLIPLGSMLVTMTLFGLYYFWRQRSVTKKRPKFKKYIKVEKPFTIGPALKFGAFLIIILALIKVAEVYLGDKGIYLSALISSLADIDAISISLAKLSASNTIASTVAVRAITIAVISNTFIKLVYIYLLGNTMLTKKLFGVFTVTSLVGIATSFLI